MNASEAGKKGWEASQWYRDQQQKTRLEEYSKNPTLCLHCGKELPYEKRKNKFCSHSCSASYANARRYTGERKRPDYINSRAGEERVCLACGPKFHAQRNTTGKYCSLKCQADHKYTNYIEKWKAGEDSGTRGNINLMSKHLRRYLLEKAGYKCEICGWNKINPTSGVSPLEIHHKDGNHLNNSEDNLQVLCPNCHSLTDTYKGLNRSNGRKNRTKVDKSND